MRALQRILAQDWLFLGVLQGDLLLLVAAEAATCHRALDRMRQHVAAQLGEVDESQHALLWVTGTALHSWHQVHCNKQLVLQCLGCSGGPIASCLHGSSVAGIHEDLA